MLCKLPVFSFFLNKSVTFRQKRKLIDWLVIVLVLEMHVLFCKIPSFLSKREVFNSLLCGATLKNDYKP